MSDPSALVIFGGTGDLCCRKLVPALYNLALDGLLPEGFAVVGVARRPLTSEEYIATLREGVAEHSRRAIDPAVWDALAARITYVQVQFDDPRAYGALAEHLAELDAGHGTGGNRLYYLAVPPSSFPMIVHRLGDAGLARPGAHGSWSRVVVEKPIGRDQASAAALNRAINEVFDERDVFRIDHYLGKETVQNLLVFRFANAIFEPLWNTKYVDHVQLTVAETIGVEGRGAYYEESGTTRDVVQNHMLQLLCLTAMEPPVSLDADAIRDEKVKVLRSLRPMSLDDVARGTVRGQYGDGVVGGAAVPAYRQEPEVAGDSTTETYVALELYIDNWRWAGVPFFLRAGKRMAKRVTEVAMTFRDVPHRLFRHAPSDRPVPNTLILRIQPDEGVTLRFDVKVPGNAARIDPTSMDFYYREAFGQSPPEAYERLLLDAMHGDGTLFIRRDEVERSWAFVDRLFEGWQRQALSALPEYTSGTWGPAEADVLLARSGRTWRRPR